MNKADLLFLFDYSIWANQKLSRTASRISAAQFTSAFPTTYGSLRGILVHILIAHRVWRKRCWKPVGPAHWLIDEEYPDFSTYMQALRAEEADWHNLLEELSEPEVQREVIYQTQRGDTLQTPLWQIVTHLVNHTTQHRSEAAEVLTQMGYSPGDLDLIWYLRQGV